jgi:V/A-type H+-transporting ATPase subunit I
MLRPRPARWFEILTARDDATLVLEALARTGVVELEARGGVGVPAELGETMPQLTQFLDLAARHRAYWPAASECRPSAFPEAPAQALQRCLVTIRAWAQEAEPLIRAGQRAEAQGSELRLWQRVLAALAPNAIDVAPLCTAGPLVQVRLFVLPQGSAAEAALAPAAPGAEVVASTLWIDDAPYLLVAGAPAVLQAVAQRVSTLKGSSHEVPDWLHSDPTANEAGIRERLQALESERAALSAQLDALSQRHGLPCALGDVHRLEWVLHNVHALEAGALFCWITGWSSDASGERLARALQESGARALLRYAPPPAGIDAPLLLHNPAWARPFEIFSRALGMPSSSEADPSALLAIAVPLMFGYMFGDVGQGLVIAVAGWWYRKRFPIARLLMVGGVSAVLFGALFGSLFSLHGVLPALWLHPLDAPLSVLLVPLLGGAVLLTLGLALDALAAWWRGELRRWLLTDALLIVVYLALLVAFAAPASLLVAAAAAICFCIGHALNAARWSAGFSAIGELIEKTFQILINTLSFARVGAFALAHAGLSAAIVALMDAADGSLAKALVLGLGNVVVIVLEAMVVSIQTTRLILFEFFTRFVQGRGRAFRPLPSPPFKTLEH